MRLELDRSAGGQDVTSDDCAAWPAVVRLSSPPPVLLLPWGVRIFRSAEPRVHAAAAELASYQYFTPTSLLPGQAMYDACTSLILA
jgi:hypothetical protein